MLTFARRGNRARHGRVREDPLEKHLGPASVSRLRGPRRQRPTAYASEQVAFGERPVDEHGDAAVAGERQDAALGFTLTDRVVHLDEVELLARQHALELVVTAR